MTKKLLALAAPAAILFASPAAFASPGPPPAPITSPAPHATPNAHAHAHAFAAFAAFLRSTAAAASATTPRLADDGCPLAGNVGKSSHADRCAMGATAIAKAGADR